jgi:hypothetical protein
VCVWVEDEAVSGDGLVARYRCCTEAGVEVKGSTHDINVWYENS